MMESSPPTPTGHYAVQQRPRYRIGGDQPYRDDPNAPPSVRLESFTPGGLGPLHVAEEKSKELPVLRRFVSTACDLCQPIPRAELDPDGQRYYVDTFNDLPWGCNVGTSDESGIWLNQSDHAGSIMAIMVWVLLIYSAFTMTLLAATRGIPPTLAMAYTTLACLALSCHVKTSLTDPGAVPTAAVPTSAQRARHQKLTMCSSCQTFKPPGSHHCRICNRCCPWMNNCVGAGNFKHFLLFLIYTWTCSVFALLLFGWNYFFCAEEGCEFTVVLTQLVRIMTVIGVGSFAFTSSMLMNVVFGIMTGIGTVDRLKKKSFGSLDTADEEPIPLTHIFGIERIYWWLLPVDPVFPDYDVVMGFSTPQRLLREQAMRNMDAASSVVSARDSWGMAV